MRLRTCIIFAFLLLAEAAAAQASDNFSVPRRIGNEANGFDYQPTPAEVVPLERAAGIAPSPEQQKRIDDELFGTNADLLRSEGLSTSSVPGYGTNADQT
jgi:hypothetical protein